MYSSMDGMLGSTTQALPLPSDYLNYEYCMVLRAVNEDFDEDGRAIIALLADAGFLLKCYLSIQKDEVLVLIGCDNQRLAVFADLINYKMLLDEEALEKHAKRGDPEKGIQPIEINHEPSITHLWPYQYIYGKYDTEPSLQDLYYRPQGSDTPFTDAVRLKLIYLLLQAPKNEGGCNLPLRKLVLKKQILAFFPLHNERQRNSLASQLLEPFHMPWNMPLREMKDYFGEKITLYFLYLSHYTTWCIPAALLGLAIQVHVAATGNTSAPSVPFYSLFVSFWAILMLEYWKRKERTTAMQWGTIGFEQEQKDRPEFHGEPMRSVVDGKEILYFPDGERANLICQSFSAIGAMILVVLGAVAAIYAFREHVHWSDPMIGSVVASTLSAFQIQVLNYVYNAIADSLTDRENHRTDTQYEDSLIVKTFLFQFVNSFSSFFYIAFVQPYRSDVPNPMDSLALNLTIIFGTKLIVGNTTEILVPYLRAKQRLAAETRGTEGQMSQPELEYILVPYDIIKGPIRDYAEIATQYGYLTLFVSAFPAAPVLALISNFVELRTDAYKLLRQHQRTIPTGVEDIGTWQVIFMIVSVLAVMSNSALVCFTMTVFDDESWLTRTWLFIVFQYFVLTCMFIFSTLVPDEPEEVEIQHQRQTFLVDKVICKVSDEDDTDLLAQLHDSNVRPDVTILPMLT